VNDAPIAAFAPMAVIEEDTLLNTGTVISDLINAGVTDPDLTTTSGIAITGVESGPGRWQYNLTTNAQNWQDVGVNTVSDALVLGGGTFLRYVPTRN
jgi:large repetitive protein